MFEKAVQLILEHEGVLSDDPRDNGGLTKYGISKSAYADIDIRNLTKEQAIAIYRRDYWDRCRCSELPWWAALIVFDAAVNQGPGIAVRLLQRAAGVPDDGIIGPKTIAAVQRMNPRLGVVQLMSHRAVRYAGTSDFDRFGRGWMARLFSITLDTDV